MENGNIKHEGRINDVFIMFMQLNIQRRGDVGYILVENGVENLVAVMLISFCQCPFGDRMQDRTFYFVRNENLLVLYTTMVTKRSSKVYRNVQASSFKTVGWSENWSI